VQVALFGSDRSLPLWVTEELERMAFSFEVVTPEKTKALLPSSFVVVLGSALLTEDEVAELALRLGVNPLRVAVFPYEEVRDLPEEKCRTLWQGFLRSLVPPKRDVAAFRVTPTRRVLLYPEGDERLCEAFARARIPVVSFPSFVLSRKGVDFHVMPHDIPVGACVLIPSLQEEPPVVLPREVLDTGRVVALERLPQVLGLSSLRKMCVVLLVPSPHPYPEDWERIFALASLPPQGAQVLVLAEEVFVAREGFEEAFRRAREAGVLFEKLPLSRVSLSPSLDMRRVVVTYTPEKDPFPVRCEAHWLVPVSRKTCVLPPFDKVLLSDREVVLELPENPNLLPFATNIPGVFVAWGDVEDLVVTVSRYLEEGSIQEEGRVRVDAERCALCLTCLRSCPTGAIGLSGDLKRCIAVNEALCARCGICAGLCPARAITFEVVHRVLGNHRL